MADPRFFASRAPLRLGDILAHVALDVQGESDAGRLFHDVASLQDATKDHLSFLDNTKYLEAFAASKAGACFVRAKHAKHAPSGMLVLVCDDPYRAFALASALFYPQPESKGISPHAHISPSASIGSGSQIDAGAVIGDGVVIGNDCRIGANCVISHSLIGNRVIIHPNSAIGQDGFGYAMGASGHIKVPQLGRVLIGDDVEIGAGVCIDRGANPDTVIGAGTKIDNLVQIGHNVQIGKHAVIVAQVGISGSTSIGDFTVIGGQVGIAGHISIGSGVQIAAQSGVMHSLESGKTYGGSPCIPIKDWHRQTVAVSELVKNKRRMT